MRFLGIDIGGANIKLAMANGYATTIPFALWREPERLRDMLIEALRAAPLHEAIAATTTGELADCFTTKSEGIRAIYAALKAAAQDRPVAVYLTDGRFVEPETAIASPQLAAASNWHALARFAARYATGRNAVLIDVGSTTTDIIPLSAGEPITLGRTDTERLLHGELVYTGVSRTPVATLVQELAWRGVECPIARELFATTLDVHLILGNLPEDSHDADTADGRPATRLAARDRLARMVGADRETFDDDDASSAASTVAAAQRRLIADGLRRVLARFVASPASILISGQGEFLAHQVLDEVGVRAQRLSLRDRLGSDVSHAATAYALAMLAQEVQGGSLPIGALVSSAS